MRLGFREADDDEQRPQRVLVWPSGATTDLKVLGLTAAALAAFGGAAATRSVSTSPGVRTVASVATVVTGVYSGLLVFGLVVGAGVNRLIKDEEVP